MGKNKKKKNSPQKELRKLQKLVGEYIVSNLVNEIIEAEDKFLEEINKEPIIKEVEDLSKFIKEIIKKSDKIMARYPKPSTVLSIPMQPISEETVNFANMMARHVKWKNCSDIINKFEQKCINSFNNKDMKQVVITLETAKELYKTATPEMKRWLEQNFGKEKLEAEYMPKPIVNSYDTNQCLAIAVYTLSKNSRVSGDIRDKLSAEATLLVHMEDYYNQTGWKPKDGELFWSLCYDIRAKDMAYISFCHSIHNPFVFETKEHAEKFVKAYKDMLLRYFGSL